MRFRYHKLQTRKHAVEEASWFQDLSATEQEQSEDRMEEAEHQWQERCEFDTKEVSECYQSCCREFIQRELNPDQQADHQLAWKDGQTGLTRKQRNTFDSMLRRNLGYKQVAEYIWQHGIPRILLTQAIRLRGTAAATEHRVQQRVGHFQDALMEAVAWLTAFADSLRVREAAPELADQRAMSARPGDRDSAARARAKAQLARIMERKRHVCQAKDLQMQRDSKKRPFSEMSPEEQKLLEAFETGKLQKPSQTHVFRSTNPGFASSSASSGAASQQASVSSGTATELATRSGARAKQGSAAEHATQPKPKAG